ncbi:MAG TPA: hypothetical protein EYP19_06625 [Desulfobacterales bacterium]|nr:hypothetical protein [Desulfobacterales bacterium]
MRRMAFLALIIGVLGFFALNPSSVDAFYQNPNLNLGATGSLEGILPPPGFYLSLYNAYYAADDVRDFDGDKMSGNNRLDAVVVIPQVYYISSRKVFGLTPGIQALCAIQGLDVDSEQGLDSGRSGSGDLNIGPFVGSNFKLTENSTLFWNFEIDVFFPTGRYDEDNLINPGANFYTIEPWFNFTWLLPHGFEISSRQHYTYNTTNRDSWPTGGDRRTGRAYHMNYAVTKTLFSENFRLGVQGYYLKQLTKDRVEHDGAVPVILRSDNSKEQVFAIGPTLVLVHKGTYFSLGTMFESNVENRPKGIKTLFRCVYKFW